VLITVSGCSSSKQSKEEDTSDENIQSNNENENLSSGDLILLTAEHERDNEMYSPSADTTYLYWLNNKPVQLRNTTKCNIFVPAIYYTAMLLTGTPEKSG
jgi:hypothetical protein